MKRRGMRRRSASAVFFVGETFCDNIVACECMCMCVKKPAREVGG